jgi:hypothetical protein
MFEETDDFHIWDGWLNHFKQMLRLRETIQLVTFVRAEISKFQTSLEKQ